MLRFILFRVFVAFNIGFGAIVRSAHEISKPKPGVRVAGYELREAEDGGTRMEE
jgi:hypothetical protein